MQLTFSQFLSDNWHLTVPLLILLALYIIFEMTLGRVHSTSITPLQLMTRIKQKQHLLVDLRSQEDYEKSHIAGAQLISADDVAHKIKQMKKIQSISIYDTNGLNAAKAARQLRKNGLDAMALSGGFLTWQKENLPTVSKQNISKVINPKSREAANG